MQTGDHQIHVIKMTPKKQQIISRAYSFYPKGISFELEKELYYNSIENQRLRKAINESSDLNSLFSSFISQLAKIKIPFYEIGPGVNLQRCFQLAFISDSSEPTYLVLCISKITSLYCFYSIQSLEFISGRTSYVFTEKYKIADLNTMQLLKSLLNTSFPGYQLIIPEYLNLELPNVEYEDFGQVNSESFPVLYSKMTIFTAFFNKFIFY